MAPSKALDEHTRKRQYQSPIHSFFQRNASTNGGSGSNSPTHSRSPLSPPLPADTQSSLLSVGMRVRRACLRATRPTKQCRQKRSRSLAQLPPSQNRLSDPLTTPQTLANWRRGVDSTRSEASLRKMPSLHRLPRRRPSRVGMEAPARCPA